jgi:hypothetical protein
MSGPFDKYVEKAAEAGWNCKLPTYWLDEAKQTWTAVPEWKDADENDKQYARETTLAALAAVGPLIQEDARERMVAAAGAALEREGGGCAQAPITSREPEGKVLAALEKWYADMDDDEGPFAFNYSSGQLMGASPESLKSLLETATKLGLELGRKEALAEIAAEMALSEPWQWTDTRFRYVDVQIDKESWRQIMAARDTGKGDSV